MKPITTPKGRFTIAVLLILSALIGGIWGGYSWGYKKGYSTPHWWTGSPEKEAKEAVVSILEEKQRCDEWDGEFYARGRFANDSSISNELTISCFKTYTENNTGSTTEELGVKKHEMPKRVITETLFNYNF